MGAFDKKKYDSVFNKENTVMKGIRFNIHKDKDLLDWLEQHKPYSEYIKNLIKQDKEKNNK